MADVQSASTQIFPLLQLPAELRNYIYQYALSACDRPHQQTGPYDFRGKSEYVLIATKISKTRHSANTALLRTCKQVYREAFDIMVKTNKFIKLTTINVDMLRALLLTELPVVSNNRNAVRQFNGYAMEVNLKNACQTPVGPIDWLFESMPGNDGPFSLTYSPTHELMILARHWEAFCAMIPWLDTFAQAADQLPLELEVSLQFYSAPRKPSKLAVSFDTMFTPKLQKALLDPFTSNVSGLLSVRICGEVETDLALRAASAVCTHFCTEPGDFLRDWQAAKAAAEDLRKAEQYEAAFDQFMHVLLKMDCAANQRCFANTNSNIGPDHQFYRDFWTLYNDVSVLIVEEMIQARQARTRKSAEGTWVVHTNCTHYSNVYRKYLQYIPGFKDDGMNVRASTYLARIARFYCVRHDYRMALDYAEDAVFLAPEDNTIFNEYLQIVAERVPLDEEGLESRQVLRAEYGPLTFC